METKVRNQNIFNKIAKLVDSFLVVMEKPFVSSYGSWYDRVKILVDGNPEIIAKILELRPDMDNKKLSLCLVSVQQCLQTLQEENVCKESPHPSSEEGFRDELVWLLVKLLEHREHLRRRGAFAEQGLERHFRETILPNIYKRYEDYLYDPSCKDILVCSIENVTFLKQIGMRDWQLRQITQEEFHDLVDANERHGIKLEAYPEFILCLNFNESDWQEQIKELITALRLMKESKIHIKRIYHVFSLLVRPWEIIDPPEGTRFVDKIPQTSYIIENGEEDELNRLWTFLNQIRRTNYIMTAVRRFNLAYERERIEDAWIDYFISLESLYQKSGETIEAIYRLSNRISKALGGATLDTRKDMRGKIKNWYNIRSKIVHGTEVELRDLRQVDELNKIVKASLKWFINNEDWEDHDKILDLLDLML